MRARGRVSVCNEMKVAIDKVAGANEQSEGEVRGWLMETRPKMGEKNCTRAARRERGRAGRALGGGDEETSSRAVRVSCGGGERGLEYCMVQGRRAGQQIHERRTPSTAAAISGPSVSSRCGASRRVWCDHAEPKNRHAPRPLCLPTTIYGCLTTRRIRALTGHCCHGAVVAPRLAASHQPSTCSRHRSPPCTPASGIVAVVRTQSIFTQIRLHRGAWGSTRRGPDPALRNRSDSLRVTRWNPSR